MMWTALLSIGTILLTLLASVQPAAMSAHPASRRRSRSTTLLAVQERCPGGSADCPEGTQQLGEPCSETQPCDHGLVCRYRHRDTDGLCREAPEVPCEVYNRTYDHGETFTLDCRTQCVCQNGTYGCSSLCPQEHISPRGTCRHPRLVEVPGQCCREWMCDGQAMEQPPSCQAAFSRWSSCSSECGAGLSSRRSNLNARCESSTEMRLCQTRRCDDIMPDTFHRDPHHHIRRGHECKATHRLSSPVHLRFGPCHSRKRYRPKFCGRCPNPDVTCEPQLSTTLKVDFVCKNLESDAEPAADLLPEFLEPGEDMWSDVEPLDRKWEEEDDEHDEEEEEAAAAAIAAGGAPEEPKRILSVSVQWLLKCKCETATAAGADGAQLPTSSTGEVILHRVHRTAAP